MPALTPETKAADKDLGVSPPGAGGWVPKPRTVVLCGMAAVILGPLGIALPAAIPGQTGLVLGALCAALGGGCTWLAMRSAGPRKVTE